jgi:hyperosmotically inducible periplasmic protein
MRKENRLKSLIAVLLLAGSIGACDAISGRETAGEYIDDTTITSKVIAEIIQDPSLKKFQVSVETMQNVVQLSGFVDSAQNISRAGDLARNVRGVQSVKNNLVVR